MIITFGQLFGIVRQLLFRSRRDEGAALNAMSNNRVVVHTRPSHIAR